MFYYKIPWFYQDFKMENQFYQVLKSALIWRCRHTGHFVKSVRIWSFFWSLFSHIRTEYGEILRIPTYSVRFRENSVQKKTPYLDSSHTVGPLEIMLSQTEHPCSSKGYFFISEQESYLYFSEAKFINVFYDVLADCTLDVHVSDWILNP